MSLGGTEYLCSPSSFFLSSIDVPIESQIVEASVEVPLLSMLLRLDMSIVREMLNREDLPESQVSSQRHGVAVGEAPAGLLKACSRLMELLDIPDEHTLSQPLDPTRNHLPRPANSAGRAAPNHCNNRRPRQQNGKSDFLAARQLYEAFAYGGAGRDLANGSFRHFTISSAH